MGIAGPGGRLARVHAGIARLWSSTPLTLRLGAVALVGACAATAVGLLTAANPAARPPNLAVKIRVVMIVALIAAGLYAQTNRDPGTDGPATGRGRTAVVSLAAQWIEQPRPVQHGGCCSSA